MPPPDRDWETNGPSGVDFGDSGDTNIGRILYDNSDNSMRFTTNASERMRVDSNGQIGLSGSTASFDTTGAVNGLQLYYETDSGLATIGSYGGSTGSTALTFHTNSGTNASAEHMRLDNSGNLLIGTTGTDPNNATTSGGAGTAIRSDGRVLTGVYQDFAADFNRIDNDGEIIRLSKDGTTVGSIGAKDGDIYIGTGDTQLRFNDDGDDIRPAPT